MSAMVYPHPLCTVCGRLARLADISGSYFGPAGGVLYAYLSLTSEPPVRRGDAWMCDACRIAATMPKPPTPDDEEKARELADSWINQPSPLLKLFEKEGDPA